MNDPGVSGALGGFHSFRELESAFGGCITLGSIEIWDSTFCCFFFHVTVLFFPCLPFDPFLMARLMWLVLVNVLLCCLFSHRMGTRALFPFTFLFLFALGGLHFRSLQACILIVVGARRREHSAIEILSHHFAFFINTIPLCYSCFACRAYACLRLLLYSFPESSDTRPAFQKAEESSGDWPFTKPFIPP